MDEIINLGPRGSQDFSSIKLISQITISVLQSVLVSSYVHPRSICAGYGLFQILRQVQISRCSGTSGEHRAIQKAKERLKIRRLFRCKVTGRAFGRICFHSPGNFFEFRNISLTPSNSSRRDCRKVSQRDAERLESLDLVIRNSESHDRLGRRPARVRQGISKRLLTKGLPAQLAALLPRKAKKA